MASSRITELAAAIQANTSKVEEYFAAQGLESPSFDAEFPSGLPPEVERSRYGVLEAADEIMDLMVGPRGIIEGFPGPQQTSHIGIQAINRYSIANKVGLDEEVSFTDLAERCDLQKNDLTRILRQAMSKHVFKEPKRGYVAHTAASKLLMDSKDLNDMLYIAHDIIWPASAHLLESIDKWKGSEEHNHTGYNIASGTTESFFENTKKDSRLEEAFANNMKYWQSRPGFGNDHSHLLSSFDWASVESVVDIGGGTGATSVALTERFPSLHCTVQDMPEVVNQGKSQISSEAASRITFMTHDFFQEQPVKNADVYFMRWVLHDWSDTKAIAIIRYLIPALKGGANIVLQEFLLPEPGMLPFYHEKTTRNMDLSMKAFLNAKERGVDDWKKIFSDADPGFKFVGVKMPMGSNLGVIQVRWEPSV
ncbi:O-methyltransferase [Lachnellula hyalina]|uniref:O-methyltransferase n=1 Tax=Lachnellula hyalina TaxID=1316788 RepID=A0A8H8QVP7_9HELO|nr:O-methyltransferase [Lachnellula hyalina]TVY22560.1 O-methyltransferase [Lachnellula hyalina]